MFDQLYSLLLDRGLVEGASSPTGWGEAVKRDVLPLLRHPKLRHHANMIESGFERLQSAIAALIVGEGNFGKSTLINALAASGVEIAKTDFLPKTWHITRYVPCANGTRHYELHYDAQSGEAKQLEQHIHQCDANGTRWENGIVQFHAESQLDQVLQLEEEHRHQTKTISPIWQVVRSNPQTENGVSELELIDSPGISQMRFGSVATETVDDFYHHADIVLWLLAADKTNAKETREAIHTMSRYGKPIIGVINRKDLIPTHDHGRVLQEVKGKFGSLLQEVVLISAKEAFLATKEANAQRYDESGLPALRRAMEQLAGQAGKRTKALSLCNTSQQAAHEAAIILRQEAEVLEKNLALFNQNIETAERFVNIGKKVIKQVQAGEKGRITAAAEKAMRETFIPYGDENDDIWDSSAVGNAIAEQQQHMITRLNEALEKKLKTLQDEIAIREYRVQSYRGDATVKSHESRTSIADQLREIQGEMEVFQIKPRGSVGLAAKVLGRKIVDGLSYCWRKIRGVEETFEERRERQKKRRVLALDALINGVPDTEAHVHKEIQQQVRAIVKETVSTLKAEVIECFDREFGTSEQVQQTINQYRQNAERAVVPPPVLYTVTKTLKAQL